MATDILTRCPSSPLAKAFQANVQQDYYDPVFFTLGAPTKRNRTSDHGVFPAGEGSSFAAQRILLMPYGEGQPGQFFYMRLYGWRSIRDRQGAVQPPTVWVFTILAEFMCRLGSLPGPVTSQGMAPAGQGFGLPISPTENLCCSVLLLGGTLGAGYYNVMPASWNYPASVAVDLAGSQMFSFDFAQGSASPAAGITGVATNCLWALM